MEPTILRSLLLLTLALGLVLAVRRPWRQAFGASPAFLLWLLPPLLAALPWLPIAPTHWVTLPTMHALDRTVLATHAAFNEQSIMP